MNLYDTLKSFLNNWNIGTTERQKLQHTYLLLTGLTILVAGIVSLINAETGRDVVRLAVVTLGAFLLNALAWSLLQSAMLSRLSTRQRRR